MQKNVLNTDLTGKVAVVTGAGGVLCSAFSKTLARAGAKVALLDLNYDAAKQFADEITAEGGIAKAYKCNVLDKAACYEVADEVENGFNGFTAKKAATFLNTVYTPVFTTSE